MTIEEAKSSIGQEVVYTPYRGCEPCLVDYGIIEFVRRRLVFVRYGTDENPKGSHPDSLKLVE